MITNINSIKQEIQCQVCGKKPLEKVLDLGMQPLCNEFLLPEELNRPQNYFPLELYYCDIDDLIQLGYVVSTEYVFGDQYTYLTGTSRTLVNYYIKWAKKLVEIFCLKPGDTVIEIGCNDGTFLKAFQALGINTIGIDGALNAADIAIDEGINIIPKFYGKNINEKVMKYVPSDSRIRLICAFNVLAHTDNIGDFLTELGSLMTKDTVFVSQSHWLCDLIRKNEFDTIYHEHLRYFTLTSLRKIFHQYKLNLYDAEITEFYGGSILTYASINKDLKLSSLANNLLREENQINVVKSLKEMNENLIQKRIQIINFLHELKMDGNKIIGLGAPMKSSTFLNYFGLKTDLIEYLAEVNPLKIGTVVPGVHINVVDENFLFNNQPDYAMIMSWNMADDIISKLKAKGFRGKFILPIPELKVLN